MTSSAPPAQATASSLADAYRAVRQESLDRCAPLHIEDYGLQSMSDASPAKWHLAHVTWFFETMVLERFDPAFAPFHPAYRFLWNSYYHAVCEQFPRPRRGLLSRPTVDEVLAYRAHVDARLLELLDDDALPAEASALVILGLHHEQQHQELLLTDLKHGLAQNPLDPVYDTASTMPSYDDPGALTWTESAGGMTRIGHTGDGFHFDNEAPCHDTYVPPVALANRLVSNGEFLAFMQDGGYDRPELWLDLGYHTTQAEHWRAPLYWQQRDGVWTQFTLRGRMTIDPHAPVHHLSYFEADAYARWAGYRLPTEAEWEHVAPPAMPRDGHDVLAPSAPLTADDHQFHHVCWQWTQSSYGSYPGFRPAAGAVGEYNGKFMCNQYVLRGSSCVTPNGHARSTYRNFFAPDARWQFSGIRLARDL